MTKTRKPRKAKALQAASEPVRRQGCTLGRALAVERAMDDVADDVRRLTALLVVIERIASALPADTYMAFEWSANDFVGLTAIARERAEELVRSAESAPRP